MVGSSQAGELFQEQALGIVVNQEHWLWPVNWLRLRCKVYFVACCRTAVMSERISAWKDEDVYSYKIGVKDDFGNASTDDDNKLRP